MKGGPNPTTFLVLAAGALVLGGGAIYYQSSQLSEKDNAISALKKKLRNEKETQLQVVETQAKVSESQARLNHLEEGVPQLAYIPTLLSELEAVGRKNGIIVSGVRPIVKADQKKDPKAKKPPYEELDIEIKGRGDYVAVTKLLTALREFPKIVAVRTVTLSPEPAAPGPGDQFTSPILSSTIELRAYLFAPSPASQVASTTETKTMDRKSVVDQMVSPK